MVSTVVVTLEEIELTSVSLDLDVAISSSSILDDHYSSLERGIDHDIETSQRDCDRASCLSNDSMVVGSDSIIRSDFFYGK